MKTYTILLFAAIAVSACAKTQLPMSDPDNKGGWVLNEELSDEFNEKKLDSEKWFVEGENNGDYYIWKGRPPSQFVPHNVLQEDGMLKIRTQWEPDYPFIKESYADGAHNDTYGLWKGKPMPVTTGAAISRKRFLYGYMEVRTKAGNASMTSSFWAIGYESELDIYEQIGNPAIPDNDIREDTWKSSVHDWSPPAKRPTRRFGLKTKMPFRVADEFHVYAAEWGEDYLKLYLDGKLMYETTREKEGINWVLNNPLEIWFDSEIFVWLGLPHADELPVDYEIDYVRIWQKPTDNLLAPQFFGFEGPILFEDNPRPLKLLPESSEVNEYQKFWEIGEHSLWCFSITKEQSAKGIKSLKFDPERMLANMSIVTPLGAIDIPKGTFELSFQIFMEEGCSIEALNLSLADPEIILDDFDLTGVERGKWVTLSRTFKRANASGHEDRLRIRLDKKKVKEGSSSLYMDDIQISAK
ncbi:family 16 glycosylhydrolase [Pontiellaceae bacterium B12227]|nr:family 16 glycosylhydrolase [Pontiellaceae bacterium B12227]